MLRPVKEEDPSGFYTVTSASDFQDWNVSSIEDWAPGFKIVIIYRKFPTTIGGGSLLRVICEESIAPQELSSNPIPKEISYVRKRYRQVF